MKQPLSPSFLGMGGGVRVGSLETKVNKGKQRYTKIHNVSREISEVRLNLLRDQVSTLEEMKTSDSLTGAGSTTTRKRLPVLSLVLRTVLGRHRSSLGNC